MCLISTDAAKSMVNIRIYSPMPSQKRIKLPANEMLIQVEFFVGYVELHILAAVFFVPYKTYGRHSKIWGSKQVHNTIIEALGSGCSRFIVRFHSGSAHGALCLHSHSTKDHQAKKCDDQNSFNAFHTTNLPNNFCYESIKNDNMARS